MKNIYVPTYIDFLEALSPFCLSLYLPAVWLGVIKK